MMERLEEAIARAKVAQDGVIGRQARQVSQSGQERTPQQWVPANGVIIDRHRVERASDSAPPARINYTKTRRVPLDPAVLEHNRIVGTGGADGPQAEAYDRLRTHVLQTLVRNGWRTLAITSPHGGAGKTLTAVNLGISLSCELNHTVLLVDLDLRRPNIAATLGLDVERGVCDVLNRRAVVEDVLINPEIPRLVILPGRSFEGRCRELVTAPSMKRMLADITTRYSSRIVIFDLPPLMRNDDALVFAPSVEASLLVVEDGHDTPDDVQRSIRLLKGANLIGTILNKAR